MSEMEPSDVRRAWRSAPIDPDLVRDFGYDLVRWEVVETLTEGDDRLVFLPADDELLRDAEFIVVDPDVLCDLAEKT